MGNRNREAIALSEADGLFKIAENPRITRAGCFLRRTSLDELHQLWNVLRGEMRLGNDPVWTTVELQR